MCIGRPPPLRHHRVVIAGKSGRPLNGNWKQTRVNQCNTREKSAVVIRFYAGTRRSILGIDNDVGSRKAS